MEVERDVVVGINSGCDDNVDGRLPSHSLDAWNVAAETDHGEVDHGFYALRAEFVEPRHRIRNTFFFIAPSLRIVLHDLGGQHENVLVHESDAEFGGVEGSSNGVDGSQVFPQWYTHKYRVKSKENSL